MHCSPRFLAVVVAALLTSGGCCCCSPRERWRLVLVLGRRWKRRRARLDLVGSGADKSTSASLCVSRLRPRNHPPNANRVAKNTRLLHVPVVFWIGEQSIPACLLQKLLLMAGIEKNPGPRSWFCTICQRLLRRGVYSVRCNSCNNWCHLTPCSGLVRSDQWSLSFIAPCCHTTTASAQTSVIPTVPPPSLDSDTDFNILQLNINGLALKRAELLAYMERNRVHVAAVQETKLSSRSKPGSFAPYTLIREDRKSHGGGLAFLVHQSVMFRKLPTPSNDPHLESLVIAVKSGTTEINLVNFYVPPTSSCASGYQVDLHPLLNIPCSILLGDANAHNKAWFSDLENDTRGNLLISQIEQSNHVILNEHQPTRVASSGTSSPDVTLASPSLATSANWRTEIALGSDHVPILVSLLRSYQKIGAEKKQFVNFAKADWQGFQASTEASFDKLPLPKSAIKGEKLFRRIVTSAAKRFIPSGRIPEIRPNFPRDAAILADERDELRKTSPMDPRVKTLTDDINKKVQAHCRQKWEEHLQQCNLNTGVKKLWKTIKGLSNPQRQEKNQTISFNGIPAVSDQRCVNLFNQQFTPHPISISKDFRNTIRKIHHLAPDPVSITPAQTASALHQTRPSKAIGPDGLSPIMLKHLGPKGIIFVTAVFNSALRSLQVPGLWKVARIIPLLKASKPVDEGKSYRPISILSPTAKLMERLILPILKEHLPSASHQHGYKKRHSTLTALHAITDYVSEGLNQRKPCERTVLVALDLSRAFDTVSHGQLLDDLLHTTLPNTIIRWIASYLRGRQTYVDFRGHRSTYRKVKQGVPQGGVLSPDLFNFYMVQLPTPPPGFLLTTYADDCSVGTRSPKIGPACATLNPYRTILNNWFKGRNLQLSAEKSTATIFTTCTREVRTTLDISIDGKLIPTTTRPKILGVTLDSTLSFAPHVQNVREKLRSRNNVLKAISGSTWGKDKEVLSTTYKAIGRPIINYAAPVWSPIISASRAKDLQASQNQALRSITGCHLMTNSDDLHRETSILPVKQHNDLLTMQYLLSCHQPLHPCHNLVTKPKPPRKIKPGLRKFDGVVTPLVPSCGLDALTYKRGLQHLHTGAVADAVASYSPNRVLNGPPPNIASEERQLPRPTRATLAQLRSGYSKQLNSYMSRVDSTIKDQCPLCRGTQHDTNHLFSCPARPTTRTVMNGPMDRPGWGGYLPPNSINDGKPTWSYNNNNPSERRFALKELGKSSSKEGSLLNPGIEPETRGLRHSTAVQTEKAGKKFFKKSHFLTPESNLRPGG